MDYDDLNEDLTKHQDTISLGDESENQIKGHHDSITSVEIEEPASYENLDTDDVIRNLLQNRTDEIVEADTRTDGNPKDSHLVTDTENTSFDSIVNGSMELDANNSLLNKDVDEQVIEENGDTENLTDSLDIDSILNSSKENTEPKLDKLCQLPLGRVKSIIKSDPDVTVVSAECVFLIAKASVSEN